jgi:large subunit ribosomal protein L23
MKKKMQVLMQPLFTEKLTRLQDHENKYAFKVNIGSNKIEIKREIEKKFNVKVLSVKTMNVFGKMHQQMTRKGRSIGRRSDWKKAIIKLAEGQKIDLFEHA